MTLSQNDWNAIKITLQLACVSTVILLFIGLSLGWFLARSQAWWKKPLEALVSLPLVLPPTVLGFYLLLAMGPNGFIGKFTESLSLGTLPFTFAGIVIATTIHSLPFVVRPIQDAIELMGNRPLEIGATLGAGWFDRFFTIVLPNIRYSILTAAILGFTHALGEFGVVLMIGGNIPGVTQVISLQIYGHVEALEYGKAHFLSFIMIVFSFSTLLFIQMINRQKRKKASFYAP